MMAVWAETESLIAYYKWRVGCDCTIYKSKCTFDEKTLSLSRTLTSVSLPLSVFLLPPKRDTSDRPNRVNVMLAL
jgi:hypothetical protein